MVIIHSNPTLQNQIDTSTALLAGFRVHGVQAEITADRLKPGDIHVVQGPWYCYSDWLGKANVVYLDRTFYGCPVNNISLGWLKADGSRNFCIREYHRKHGKGELPELKEKKTRQECAVVFGDYGRNPGDLWQYARSNFDRVYFRAHPASKDQHPYLTLKGELDYIWRMADVAVGHSTTALIEAELEGLNVVTTDRHNPVNYDGDRESWLNELSWKQWSLDELRDGSFWDHLC